MQNDIPFTRRNRVADLAGGRFQAGHSPSVKTDIKLFSPVRDETPNDYAATNTSRAFWSQGSKGTGIPQDADSNSGSQTPESPLIYAVDDLPCLTELYAAVLEAVGHSVRIFTNRNAAVAALKTEKPALLITDFRNPSMPTDRFLQECVATHPDLRILMATGFGHQHAWFSSVTPDRFIQKPFTPEDLLREVSAALTGVPASFAR